MSELDPQSTAVLITDPQVDFLKPESVVWDKIGETVEENAVVDKLRRLREAANEGDNSCSLILGEVCR